MKLSLHIFKPVGKLKTVPKSWSLHLWANPAYELFAETQINTSKCKSHYFYVIKTFNVYRHMYVNTYLYFYFHSRQNFFCVFIILIINMYVIYSHTQQLKLLTCKWKLSHLDFWNSSTFIVHFYIFLNFYYFSSSAATSLPTLLTAFIFEIMIFLKNHISGKKKIDCMSTFNCCSSCRCCCATETYAQKKKANNLRLKFWLQALPHSCGT